MPWLSRVSAVARQFNKKLPKLGIAELKRQYSQKGAEQGEEEEEHIETAFEKEKRKYEEIIVEIDDMLKFIEDHADDVKSAFALYDKYGTGEIVTSKLLTILRALGMNPTEEEVFDLQLEVDADGNGFIDFIEFLKMMKKVWAKIDKSQLEELSVFDTSGATKITMSEVREAVLEYGDILDSFSPVEVREMMEELDMYGHTETVLDKFSEVFSSTNKVDKSDKS